MAMLNNQRVYFEGRCQQLHTWALGDSIRHQPSGPRERTGEGLGSEIDMSAVLMSGIL